MPLPNSSRSPARLASILATVALTCAFAVPHVPAAVAAETPQVLAGTSVVAVEGDAHAVVSLEHNARLLPYSEHVSIDTEGRFAAVAMVERGRSGRAVYFVARANEQAVCGGPCPKASNGGYFGHRINELENETLPAGIYDLYVVSPDGPATITITVPGAPGDISVTTSPHEDVVFKEAANRSPAGNQALYHAGADGELNSQGILHTLFVTSGQVDTAAVYGDCVYVGGEPALLPYMGGCHTAEDGSRFQSAFITNSGWTTSLTALTVHANPGVYGLGTYREGASTAVTATTYLLWLPYVG